MLLNCKKVYQSGFSLAELSVVLVIVSLVVGMSLSAGQTYMASMRTASIQHQLASVREALHLFRTKYGRYPCPARENDVISSATYGYEVQSCQLPTVDTAEAGITHSNTYFSSGSLWKYGRIVRGMIPFKSLGITQSSAIDPWNNKISYAIDLVHVVSSTVGPGTLGIVDSNNNSIAVSPAQGNAVFALISHGEDGNGAYPANSATQIACGTGAKAVENCDDDDVYMDALPTNSSIASEQYDDYVLWYAQQREDDVQQQPVTMINYGYAVCAIKPDKTLWCWGSNDRGGVGDGTWVHKFLPTQVSGGGAWQSVSAEIDTLCGIKTDATLWCWGMNIYGAVGDGTTANKSVPTQVSGGGSWRFVQASYPMTCGIKTDGTLWCWGGNYYGTLGDGTTVNKSVPTQVSGGGTWKSLDGLCAIKSDDTLWCWGSNNYGQVGDGTTVNKTVPTQVSGGGSWKRNSHGNNVTPCAIKSDDTLWCWGGNFSGQVGDGTIANKSVPTQVSGGGTWKVVYAGSGTTCAIKSDDTLWCWGENQMGEVGDGTTVDKSVPTQVSGGGTWKTVYNGGSALVCGIKTDDTLWCWGGQYDGATRSVPTLIHGGKRWKYVFAHSGRACGIALNDTAWCWGWGSGGGLGNGTYGEYLIPIPVAFPR